VSFVIAAMLLAATTNVESKVLAQWSLRTAWPIWLVLFFPLAQRCVLVTGAGKVKPFAIAAGLAICPPFALTLFL
jgi:hypothetical protein